MSTVVTPDSPDTQADPKHRATSRSLLDPEIVRGALADSVRKLHPRIQARNPVMFVVLVGSVLTTFLFVRDLGDSAAAENVFAGLVALFLWFTVLFANFAEAMAEGRGKAQAATLRRARSETMANRRTADGTVEQVPSSQLTSGDVVVVSAGEMIPSDGEIIEGIASVDESAITGESAPVIRESGGDRSAVTGGTRVLSDRIVVRITAKPGETFLDRMIALVEGAERQKTPNEIALNILLAGLTIVFLLAVVTLQPFAIYSGAEQEVVVLVALLVCLIPTTIGALLSAIGIAGMDRLVQHNVLAMSGRAVEAAGDCSTLLLDKTGTITLGNRQAAEFLALPGVSEERLAAAAQLASLADETPEGRSIVVLAKERFGLRERDVAHATLVPFTAQTRMSGLDLDGTSIGTDAHPENVGGDAGGAHQHRVRKGAAESVRRWVTGSGGRVPEGLDSLVEGVATGGGTPLVVAEARAEGGATEVLGVVHLKDVVKEGMRQRFDQLRAMGLRTVMITGDNPLTARAIATEAGVDDFLAEATPEDKMALIRKEQEGGRLVAMTGDGTNDAPALAQADVGVAMNTGTQAAKEAGNMVDLDSNPTKLIEVVEIGKQLLITRGSLTTFSIANDVAKYFAIIPAMFSGVLPALDDLDVMGLETPRSAILSAVIFNALVIVALIPLSLRGVKFRAESAAVMLRRNLLIYGLGGIVAPFAGIKLVDLVISALGVS
jgi:K+-transporting ATPase ATPase B chain